MLPTPSEEWGLKKLHMQLRGWPSNRAKVDVHCADVIVEDFRMPYVRQIRAAVWFPIQTVKKAAHLVWD